MYELLRHLIAFKYACKLNHWTTDEYSKHLLFDRLSENIDDWVDNIAECYFMAEDKKKVLKNNILNPDYVQCNLPKACESIIENIEGILKGEETNEGMGSLLSAIEEGFLNKLALANLA